jgi:hypothetical protein
VTGTFDNWTKSVKLEKQGDIFQKTVDLSLPTDSNKIHYKVRDAFSLPFATFRSFGLLGELVRCA